MEHEHSDFSDEKGNILKYGRGNGILLNGMKTFFFWWNGMVFTVGTGVEMEFSFLANTKLLFLANMEIFVYG